MEKNHIFIGDNLAVMQSENFKSKVNMVDTIYIDPPYNTKNSFSYSDCKGTNDWINFMDTRLRCAKNLLKETGVIFISIDDNEYANLKMICDNIFQTKNFLGTFITHQAQRSNAKFINTVHEYILCYAKNKTKTREFKIKRWIIPEEREMMADIIFNVGEAYRELGRDQAQKILNQAINYWCEERNITWLKNYNTLDDEGNICFGKDLSVPSAPNHLVIPEIGLDLPPLGTRGWASAEHFKEIYYANKLIYKNGRPYEKHLLVDAEDNVGSILPFYSRQGTNDLNRLGLRDLFDTPKPVDLIKYLIRISTPKNGDVLDFFGGSGTTAQAIYELNQEENANRHYALIQLDEPVNTSAKSYTVCSSFGIKPIISELMIYRINTYLKLSGQEKDYLLTND